MKYTFSSYVGPNHTLCFRPRCPTQTQYNDKLKPIFFKWPTLLHFWRQWGPKQWVSPLFSPLLPPLSFSLYYLSSLSSALQITVPWFMEIGRCFSPAVENWAEHVLFCIYSISKDIKKEDVLILQRCRAHKMLMLFFFVFFLIGHLILFYFHSSEILPSKHVEFFEPWVFVFGYELILHSTRQPLISGFYKLLSVVMKNAKKLKYFKVWNMIPKTVL